MQNVTPVAIAALGLELVPAVLFGCAGERVASAVNSLTGRFAPESPALLVVPYAMVSISAHIFQWTWFALYMFLPVAIAGLLMRAAAVDPEQRGDWRDAFILLVLGLAVDLRWFDAPGPPDCAP